MSLPQERSTAEEVFCTWVARSRSRSSSTTALPLNKLFLSSSLSLLLLQNKLNNINFPPLPPPPPLPLPPLPPPHRSPSSPPRRSEASSLVPWCVRILFRVMTASLKLSLTTVLLPVRPSWFPQGQLPSHCQFETVTHYRSCRPSWFPQGHGPPIHYCHHYYKGRIISQRDTSLISQRDTSRRQVADVLSRVANLGHRQRRHGQLR